jgi:hypothetical protein
LKALSWHEIFLSRCRDAGSLLQMPFIVKERVHTGHASAKKNGAIQIK